ncbi:hypothetical protein F5Y04DRAFT_45580 [Hypomontagnella monticulosa]|nr:hypothetical protein F5Y04DRAFT_45580 [Hypomontagnella monticulosa]
MQPTGRKRLISSCIPCYTRKQKCNREYPCSHCARRRRPEECAYYPSPASSHSANSPESRKEDIRSDNENITSRRSSGSAPDWNAYPGCTSKTSLVDLFGYLEDSDSNTLALVRKLGLDEEDNHHGNGLPLPPDAADEVQRNIERMPDRQILDFLIRYFVSEVNWMDQAVHLPWFLSQYQRWWTIGRPTRVSEVDFAVLILRICSYACLFLPSPSYTLDRIRGVLLADIRSTCDDVAETLSGICSRIDARGSLVRVLHLSFFGLKTRCEGRINDFWEALGRAIRVAQSAGLHSGSATSRHGLDELDKEMRRRAFCNLYVWDSLLSRQLDRIPFLPGGLSPANWPQMRLISGVGDETESEAVEGFTERILQARLSEFWSSTNPPPGVEYDMTVAEVRYEKFCSEFLATLPSAFALQPNTAWDKRLHKLPLQRQLLHIAIFDSLCWNFRPMLLRGPNDIQSLPAYKRVLLSTQKKALAVAALRVLDNVTTLHAMLGGCHTRFPGLVFSTFEAAVLLAYLCMDPRFPGDGNDGTLIKSKTDPLRAGMASLTRTDCIQGVHDALSRLRMLAEVSHTAEGGANTITRLLEYLNKVEVNKEAVEIANIQQAYNSPVSQVSEVTNWLCLEPTDPNSLNEFLSSTMSQDLHPNWDTIIPDFSH